MSVLRFENVLAHLHYFRKTNPIILQTFQAQRKFAPVNVSVCLSTHLIPTYCQKLCLILGIFCKEKQECLTWRHGYYVHFGLSSSDCRLLKVNALLYTILHSESSVFMMLSEMFWYKILNFII